MEFPMPPSCPQCGSVPVRLLRMVLNDLIQSHGMTETIDSLGQLIGEYAELEDNQPLSQEWAKLETFMEQATAQSLRIQNLQHQRKEAG